MMKIPDRVEQFNRELDRILQGKPPRSGDLSDEDQRALQLANHLASDHLSERNDLRQSLRRHLVKRAVFTSSGKESRVPAFVSRNTRSLVGTIVAMMLVIVWVFGVFNPQSVAATPAYTTTAPLQDTSSTWAAARTAVVTRYQDIVPKPIPTPVALSNNTLQPSVVLSGTPFRAEHTLGNQFPIVTTTVSK